MSIADYIAISGILFLIIAFYWGQKPKPILILWSILGVCLAALTSLIYVVADLSLEQAITVGTGYTGLLTLAFVLNIGPLFRFFKNKLTKTLYKYRRNIGVAMFILATMHYFSIWSIIFSWDYNITQTIVSTGSEYAQGIQNGLVMMFILFAIAVTSNTKSQKFLKKWWKRLQLLAYLVLLMTIFHVTHVGRVFDQVLAIRVLFWLVIVFTILLKSYDEYLKFQKKKTS
jgi:DMSO/TMAO reductase YedYZ heme-binding membrane subunit